MSKLSSFLHKTFGIAEKHLTPTDIEEIVTAAQQPGATAEVEAIAADWLKTKALALPDEERAMVVQAIVTGAPFPIERKTAEDLYDFVAGRLVTYAVSKVDTLLTHVPAPKLLPGGGLIKSGEVVG